jgi:hypothetical protein
MNDDEMDELLIQGARDYNEPGSVPRDAMWARIEGERHGSHGRATLPMAPRQSPRAWAVGALAAAMVLGVGIVIGRRLERATTPQGILVDAEPNRAVTDVLPVTSSRDSVVKAIRNETKDTDASVRRLSRASAPATAGDESKESQNLAYRLVMLRHLAGSEAMITAFRSSARRGEVDAQIGDWSRELLGTTRLLEASPVTQDPTMKRLLEDLDLVLAQIGQYVTNGKNDPNDLDLIEQSIDKRGVITKLRSSLPARMLPAGT